MVSRVRLTPGQQRIAQAGLYRFFPESVGLTSGVKGLAHQTFVVMQLQRRGIFRGCSHSIMFRLPYLLDPQVAPTAEALCLQGGRAVYTTQWTCGHPHELWYRYVPEIEQLARQDFHPLDCGLVGRYRLPLPGLPADVTTDLLAKL